MATDGYDYMPYGSSVEANHCQNTLGAVYYTGAMATVTWTGDQQHLEHHLRHQTQLVEQRLPITRGSTRKRKRISPPQRDNRKAITIGGTTPK